MTRAAAIGLLIAALAAVPFARADAIDGEWCSGKGQKLMIAGPRIKLPSGKETSGLYGRHGFAYAIPAGEDGAGTIVYLEQISEEEMLLRVIDDGTSVPPDPWRRCNVTS